MFYQLGSDLFLKELDAVVGKNERRRKGYEKKKARTAQPDSPTRFFRANEKTRD